VTAVLQPCLHLSKGEQDGAPVGPMTARSRHLLACANYAALFDDNLVYTMMVVVFTIVSHIES
jgi:hypothetical protein